MAQAGLNVPRVLEWDEALGFMLLDDLGTHTMIEVVDAGNASANQGLYLRAVDALVAWQAASQPGVLPRLRRGPAGARTGAVPRLVPGAPSRRQGRRPAARDTGQPLQADHRAQPRSAQRLRAPRLHAAQPDDARATRPTTRLGVLDFQDAVYGPITYDIASLMRDAFLSWDEEFVLDITVRYWQKALKAGLPVDRGLRRVLPRRGVDGPAAPPEGGRHLRAADACATASPSTWPTRRASSPTSAPRPGATANWHRCCACWTRSKARKAVTGYAFGRV